MTEEASFLDGTAAVVTEERRIVRLGPDTYLWVSRPGQAIRSKLETVRNPQVRIGLYGQVVVTGWTELRVPDGFRWDPRPDRRGTLPYSKINAGLVLVRSSEVREAVERVIAAWDAERPLAS